MKFKHFLIAFFVLLALAITYWLASPLFIDKKVHENIGEIMKSSGSGDSGNGEEQPEIIKSGAFIGADNFHMARGKVVVLKARDKYFVRFEDNFSVTNGPDLFVYFGKDGKYSADARIGRLKGNIGSQNYEVPASFKTEDYNEVWIWCRAFSVSFGHAVLK